jgi:hypothetical protein
MRRQQHALIQPLFRNLVISGTLLLETLKLGTLLLEKLKLGTL